MRVSPFLAPILPQQELWVALRDTHGVPLPSNDRIAVLLSVYPPLRGLHVSELADRLDCTEAAAQVGIATFIADTFGESAPMIPGASFDLNVMRQGRPALAVRFVRDARGRLGTEPV